IVDFYQSNFGMINSYMADELRQTYDEWDSQSEEPALIIIKAMKIALEKNARNWKFVCGVLRQWEGKAHTLADAEALETEHRNRGRSDRQGRQREPRAVGADVKHNIEEFDRLAKAQNSGVDMEKELAEIDRLKQEMGMKV
ncbi:DnaD domain-containing protein, partial [Ligilactobacillus sp.]|uniref:DnaD domain-containing protein n=1 Tax=Ligilactobacillus sp. TaxID=2767921 RepID=UPI002FE3D009